MCKNDIIELIFFVFNQFRLFDLNFIIQLRECMDQKDDLL